MQTIKLNSDSTANHLLVPLTKGQPLKHKFIFEIRILSVYSAMIVLVDDDESMTNGGGCFGIIGYEVSLFMLRFF